MVASIWRSALTFARVSLSWLNSCSAATNHKWSFGCVVGRLTTSPISSGMHFWRSGTSCEYAHGEKIDVAQSTGLGRLRVLRMKSRKLRVTGFYGLLWFKVGGAFHERFVKRTKKMYGPNPKTFRVGPTHGNFSLVFRTIRAERIPTLTIYGVCPV